MKERPIIFSTEMVKAILEGRKTMTRRVIKDKSIKSIWHDDKGEHILAVCPYGQVGDRLWVRETWAVHKKWDELKPSAIPPNDTVYYPDGGDPEDEIPVPYWVGIRRPSIHMPRWASRIDLEITDIRVERLQEITYGDCIAEGLDMTDVDYIPGWDVSKFKSLWDSLNAKRGYSWESNPFVWVIEFKRIHRQEMPA